MLPFYIVVVQLDINVVSDVNAQKIIEDYLELQMMEDQTKNYHLMLYKLCENHSYDSNNIII